jgi:hypothetical protein
MNTYLPKIKVIVYYKIQTMYQIHQHYKFWVTHPSEFLKSKLIGRTFSIQEKISLKNAQNGLKIFLI